MRSPLALFSVLSTLCPLEVMGAQRQWDRSLVDERRQERKDSGLARRRSGDGELQQDRRAEGCLLLAVPFVATPGFVQ